MFNVKCGWGWTKAKLQYVDQGVYYWITPKGFKFLTHDLENTIEITK